MKEAVIVTAARTAVGKAPRGVLSQTRSETMGVAVLREVIRRTPGLEPQAIDDVIVGCSFPEAEQGVNLGRVLVMAAGLPDSVAGMTVNRFCSQDFRPLPRPRRRIMTDQADCILAGGVESMSLIPWVET